MRRKINIFPTSNIKKKAQIFETLHSAQVLGLTSGASCFIWDRYSLSWAFLAAEFQVEYLSWWCLWYCLEISLLKLFFLINTGSEWFIWKACLLGGPSLVIICADNTAVGWSCLCAAGLLIGSSATGFLPEQYLFTCSSKVKLCL